MEQSSFQERLQAFISGRVRREGTINAMLKMRLEDADEADKRIILHFPVEAWELNPAGRMHGGMISAALDVTMGCAAYVNSTASFTPTIQMSVAFVKGIEEGEELLIEGICDHVGSRMAQTRAIARRKSDLAVVATANGSYAINRAEKDLKAAAEDRNKIEEPFLK